MTTIVSVTPVSVNSDSRTFKEAASFARTGYASIVVEGERSALQHDDLPFRLLTVGDGPSSRRQVSIRREPTSRFAKGRDSKTWHGLVERLKRSPAGPPLQFTRFMLNYLHQYVYRSLRTIPAASLYYLHSPYQFPAVSLLARWHKARIIYDAHDFYSGIQGPDEKIGLADRWTIAFLRWVESCCIQRADAVVTVSEGIAALQRDAFGCKSVVLRNCHDSRLEGTVEETLRSRLGLASSDFLLVTVGQAKPGQAIHEALHAMRDLPHDVHLAFVGKNYDQFQDDIDRMGLTERVHIVPAVGANQVVSFVQSANAALVLYYSRSVNYQNCLPNGLFQAIAAGLPLLYPELREIRTLADRYEFGLPIVPQDHASIRDGVLRLYHSPGNYAELRTRLDRARLELSWEREENVLLELVRQVLT